jgi:hypothetical protein
MKITEIFANTGEVVERQATTDELAQMKINQAEAKAEEAKAKSAADAKSALLTKLGISAEEANLLLS